MVFRPHPNADRRRNSAVALIKVVLASNAPEILPEHRRELISILLWKITEADGKYNTRYMTSGALECNDKSELRHEHVYQRAKMISVLLNANPASVDSILNSAAACTVTQNEHLLLNNFENEYGWDRYQKAGLAVFDTLTGERMI